MSEESKSTAEKKKLETGEMNPPQSGRRVLPDAEDPKPDNFSSAFQNTGTCFGDRHVPFCADDVHPRRVCWWISSKWALSNAGMPDRLVILNFRIQSVLGSGRLVSRIRLETLLFT